jgi:hypothetical protein
MMGEVLILSKYQNSLLQTVLTFKNTHTLPNGKSDWGFGILSKFLSRIDH